MTTTTTMTTAAAPAPSDTAPPDDAIGREDRSALLCCDEPTYRDYLAVALHQLGFKVHHAAGHEAARHRLAGRLYDAIVLLENLEGCAGLADNALLHHLGRLETEERRQTFVVLLGQSFTTQDEQSAYALSVDLLVHYQDVEQFTALVAPAYEDRREAQLFFHAQGSEGK